MFTNLPVQNKSIPILANSKTFIIFQYFPRAILRFDSILQFACYNIIFFVNFHFSVHIALVRLQNLSSNIKKNRLKISIFAAYSVRGPKKFSSPLYVRTCPHPSTWEIFYFLGIFLLPICPQLQLFPPAPCTVCSFKTTRQSSLKIHFERKHKQLRVFL